MWVWTTCGLKRPHQADQLRQRLRVAERLHRLLQLGQEAHRRALLLGQLGERLLARGKAAVDE